MPRYVRATRPGSAQTILEIDGDLVEVVEERIDFDPGDDVEITVTDLAAERMTKRLAREEGLFAGTSSGANVVAALSVAERLGPDATVVTILCDSGLRYLSTDLYRDA